MSAQILSGAPIRGKQPAGIGARAIGKDQLDRRAPFGGEAFPHIRAPTLLRKRFAVQIYRHKMRIFSSLSSETVTSLNFFSRLLGKKLIFLEIK